ncbi:MAG TPA: murein biosynthesis integral membrane protein MurJ [Planctomycetota bacterium]|nr:murein biosynthesis integral membrane protein MurJ [Planctomycetota bacterium]
MSTSVDGSDHAHRSFLGAAKLIAACTLASLVLGAVRDVLMAFYFGAGLVTSAFVTAWTVPNLFRRLFGEGAVSPALVPVFTTSIRTGLPDDTRRLFSVTFTAMFLFLAALTLLIEAVVNGLRGWGTFGDRTTLVLDYTALLMPYMLLICLTAFFMAVLNAYRHFFAPAVMPVVLNVVWITSLYVIFRLTGDQASAGRRLAVAILVGGGLQLLFQVPFAMRFGVRLRPSLDFSHPGFRQIVRLWIPVIVGSAVIQVNAVLDRALAYFIVPDDGSAAYLFFGNRLMHFPISLIGVAISTAVLTPLSEHAATGETERFKRTLMAALRVTLFLAIPAGIGLMALSSPIIELLFRRGEFTSHAATRTAWVVFCYCLSVWAQTGVFVLLRGFYALKDTRTPVRVAVAVVLLNLTLNLTFIWFLDEAGLALATSISGMVQFVVLLAILRRRLGPMGGREVAVVSLKTLAVSLVMGVAAAAAWYWCWPGEAGLAVRAGVLSSILLGAIIVFIVGARLLRTDELTQILRIRSR